jgi:hypothetical protein
MPGPEKQTTDPMPGTRVTRNRTMNVTTAEMLKPAQSRGRVDSCLSSGEIRSMPDQLVWTFASLLPRCDRQLC